MSLKDLFPATRRAVANVRDDVLRAHDLIRDVATELRGVAAELRGVHDELTVARKELWDARIELADAKTQMDECTDKLFARIEVADAGINSNINYKDKVADKRATSHGAKEERLLWELYRKEGETLAEARRRLFRAMSPADGPSRVLQLGIAQLLREFDALCAKNGLEYWLSYGTLIGAVRHEGFIPWDDDADLAMMRDDVERLRAAVADDPRYELTECYDPWTFCHQLRFRYAEGDLPCFVDVFVHDYTPSLNRDLFATYLRLRGELIGELKALPFYQQWFDDEGYLAPESEHGRQVAEVFARYQEKARQAGMVCDREHAAGIIYGLENLSEYETGRWPRATSEFFPLARLPFEGAQLLAPAEPDLALTTDYGDYWQLPGDIETHEFFHLDHDKLRDPAVLAAISAKVEGGATA